MARELLERAGLSWSAIGLLAFDAGPGSFTGLRIGCGLAQGLALGVGCPVVAVGSLAALAWPYRARPVVAAIDARMGEIYSASFEALPHAAESSAPTCVGGPRVAAPAEIAGRIIAFGERWRTEDSTSAARSAPWVAAGDAFARYPELARLARDLGAEVIVDAYPGASALAALAALAWGRGEVETADAVAPVYVRDKVALDVDEQAMQRSARGGGA